jgi:hypothetical protein
MDNADALAVSGLAAAFITQGFGFFYGQLDELLQRHRDGRLAEPIDVPQAVVPELVGPIAPPLVASPEIVENRLPQLRQLSERLGRHVGQPLDVADPRLRVDVAEMIGVLEAVFGQRFTASLDEKPPSGLRISQEADDVHGPMTALRVGRMGPTAHGAVEQKIKTIHPDGEATAVHLDYLG